MFIIKGYYYNIKFVVLVVWFGMEFIGYCEFVCFRIFVCCDFFVIAFFQCFLQFFCFVCCCAFVCRVYVCCVICCYGFVCYCGHVCCLGSSLLFKVFFLLFRVLFVIQGLFCNIFVCLLWFCCVIFSWRQKLQFLSVCNF